MADAHLQLHHDMYILLHIAICPDFGAAQFRVFLNQKQSPAPHRLYVSVSHMPEVAEDMQLSPYLPSGPRSYVLALVKIRHEEKDLNHN